MSYSNFQKQSDSELNKIFCIPPERELSADGGITWQKYTAGDGERKIKLGTTGVSHWKPNMSINYVMDINPGKPVSFVPELTEWDESDEQYAPRA